MRVTEDLKSLIRGMLTVDPEARLTIAQIRAHAWIGVIEAVAEEDAPAMLDWAAAPPAVGLMGTPPLDTLVSPLPHSFPSKQFVGSCFGVTKRLGWCLDVGGHRGLR